MMKIETERLVITELTMDMTKGEFEGVGPYQGEERNICKFTYGK